MGYPTAEEELRIAALSEEDLAEPIDAVWSPDRLVELQKLAASIAVDETLIEAAVALVRSSRPGAGAAALVTEYLRWGAGPRASRFLVQAARVHAHVLLEPRTDWHEALRPSANTPSPRPLLRPRVGCSAPRRQQPQSTFHPQQWMRPASAVQRGDLETTPHRWARPNPPHSMPQYATLPQP